MSTGIYREGQTDVDHETAQIIRTGETYWVEWWHAGQHVESEGPHDLESAKRIVADRFEDGRPPGGWPVHGREGGL